MVHICMNVMSFDLQFENFFAIIKLMKYAVQDKVIHCRNGVSTILNVVNISDREYYLIRSLRGDGENIYVPIIGCENIIRPIMDISTADRLLFSLKDIEKEFNPNTKQRRDAYKRRLASGNVDDIAYLYRQYYLYNKNPENVKLGPADVDMLEYATNILLDELALTYQVDREEAEKLVVEKIDR